MPLLDEVDENEGVIVADGEPDTDAEADRLGVALDDCVALSDGVSEADVDGV